MEAVIASPLGQIKIRSNGKALLELKFTEEPLTEGDLMDPILEQTRTELREYFDGTRKEFSVNISQNGTPFQKRIWEELVRIPYGETISYGELARRAGSPTASRAAGSANGRNGIAILVPCHRVIQSDHKIGGYASGPLHKSFLLDLEKASYRK